MDVFDKLKNTIDKRSDTRPSLHAKVRTIKVCFDPVSDEYLNFGIIVNGPNNECDFRILETMTRINCLIGDRISVEAIIDIKQHIEQTIIRCRGDIVPGQLGPNIKICEPRFASGPSISAIAEQSYLASVPLGRERLNATKRQFHFKTTPRLKMDVLDILEKNLDVYRAKKIIHRDAFEIRTFIEDKESVVSINLPLASDNMIGDIVSAHFADKNRIVAEMLSPILDLRFAREILNAESASLSLLRPGEECGLSKKDFNTVNSVIDLQVARIQREGIHLIQADNAEELAHSTARYWQAAS